jgi:uncharacterized protein YndB with AHSA1/START domain
MNAAITAFHDPSIQVDGRIAKRTRHPKRSENGRAREATEEKTMKLGATEHQLEVTTTDRQVVMTRTFDAPRELVFDAFTKPEIVKRWLLGPDGLSLAVCDVDLKIGGTFRYVWRNDADGHEFVVRVYTEITRPERVAHTEKFDDPGRIARDADDRPPRDSAGLSAVVELNGESEAIRGRVLFKTDVHWVGRTFDKHFLTAAAV